MRTGTHTMALWRRLLLWCLAIAVFVSACATPTIHTEKMVAPAVDGSGIGDAGTTEERANRPEETAPVPTASPTPVKITIPSQEQDSEVTIHAIESTPVVSADAEPLIFTGIGIDQKCGHGDVVAVDGHSLRATPRITADNSNFLELLPLGARVDIIDCRLWTDQRDLSWLAVRTAEKKLGWMLVQSDKFYVTLYPVPLEPPRALTGIPAGTTVAYVPPSECKEGPVSNEAMVTSIGIDFIPVVGDLKGLGEAATGCDLVTGESLGNWRWLGLLGLIGLAEVAVLRHGDEITDAARMADNLEGSLRYSDEVAMAAGRNADTIADLARGASKLDEAADTAADAIRAADKGGALSDEAVQALAKFEQPCSFSGDTLVSAQTGSVPISEIRPGDLVLAYNESVGATGYYTVTAVFAHMDSAIVTIAVGSDVLITTPEHPFYVGGEWVPAGELEVDAPVAKAFGAPGAVRQAETTYQAQVMYNLTVAEAHTYFVGSGEWLVHNACGRILRASLDVPQKWEDEVVEWQAHHIIPAKWETHPFVEAATEGGWKVDGARNGIALPYVDEVADQYKLPSHGTYDAGHRAYSETVGRELDALNNRRVRESWEPQRAKVELEKLADRLRIDILNMTPGRRITAPN